MDLIDRNLAGKLGEILERDGAGARIRYGFNSGGDESFLYVITTDGGTLAIGTVIAEINKVDFTDAFDPQWHVRGYAVNYEDRDLVDDHTGRPIPAAYL
ncbi:MULTISPECIES: hypothetical protein [Mycolicibacter]|uniref:Immunity protein 35 domain-containing protein n=2 Tax=Mycolicibacter TaxID=1073531 RepID=A0ABU5XQH0_9MYCO|nr:MULTISPECIES: hypothetical protein [unclassified Mycolicibacter]MEB3023336.1 hypothetical protein [Mycolicibacter sp. MYC098]MEB3035128.1 hypothetical protein [Mycolicibacter sp. MYC340]